MFLKCAYFSNRLSQLLINVLVGAVSFPKISQRIKRLVVMIDRPKLFLFALGLLLLSSAQASPLVNHAVGSATSGNTYWSSTGGCTSCHADPPSDASFSTSNGTDGPHHTLAYYATNPANITTGIDEVTNSLMDPYRTSAKSNQNNLSAYFASLIQPVLAAVSDLTLAPGATYPSGTNQIAPASSNADYLVDTTTYNATPLPTGISINASGVISGTAPTSATPFNQIVTLSATNNGLTGTTQFRLIVKGTQTISFGAVPTVTVGSTGNVSITASGGSGNSVVLTSQTPSVCSISGSVVTGITVGTCTIAANQAGSATYTAASQQTQNITIGKGSQTLVFGSAPTVVVGGTGNVSVTGGGSSQPVVLTSQTTGVCTIAGSVVTGVTVGSCTIAANQAGDTNYNAASQQTQNISVGKGSQAITFGSSPSISVGGTGSVSATGGASGNPVIFTSSTTSVCTTSGTNGTTVTGVSAGTCTILADQASSADYNAAAQTPQSFSIGQGGQTVTFGVAPSGIVVGGTGSVSATASSGLAISSYTSNTPSTCSVVSSTGVVTGLAAGSNNCTILATQNGNGSYSSASQTQTFSIGIGSQSISFGAAPSVAVGGTGSVSATATSGLPVTYSTSTSSTCSVNASSGLVTGLLAGSNNCVIQANQAGDANYTAASQATQTLSIGQGNQTVSFGAAPSVSVNGTGTVSATATSNLAVVYSSVTPSACSVNANSGVVTGLAAGTSNCTIAANQSGNANFSAAPQQTQTFSIGIASQTITFGSAPTVTEGGTGTVTATATSGLAVVFSTSSTACSVNPSTGVVQGITLGSNNCTVDANQSGNANFSAAPQVSQTFSIGAAAPVAGAATVHVPLNTATTIDLSPYISGSGITGIKLVWQPTHGSAVAGGKKVLYTPTNNYFGEDTFTYSVMGAGGTSGVGVVKVVIDGRPDPTKDTSMTQTMRAQMDTASRFSQAQLTNVEQRFDTLHSRMSGALGARFNSFGPSSTGIALQPSASLNSLGQIATAQSNNVDQNSNSSPNSASQSQSNGFSADVPKIALQSNNNMLADSSGAASSQFLGGAMGNALISALQTRSFNLAALNNIASASEPNAPDAVEVWMSGNIKFGSFNNGVANGFSNFRTDGVTIGADKLLLPNLTLGAALGYAFDKTTLVNDDSNIKSQGISLALYGSYFPVEHVFIDGLIGYGALKVDSHRYVSALGQYADSTRRGDQFFASVSSGYEWRKNGWMFSPYGRFDASYNRLDETTESGVGNFAIHYDAQDSTQAKASVGLKVQGTHQTNYGILMPRMKLEYQNRLTSSGTATVQYADQLGTSYQIQGTNQNHNAIVFGVGADMAMRNGVKLNFDYQTLRSVGYENSQAVSVRVAKELGAPPMPIPMADQDDLTMPTLGVRVDLSYTFDDNVNRSKEAGNKLNERFFTINLSKSMSIPVRDNTRVVLTGFVGAEKAYTYRGLDKVSGGGQAEFQYRPSGEYTAPTFGVFARVSSEQFNSKLRDGYRFSGGFTVRKPWTDRINTFAALAYNGKDSNSPVFDSEEVSIRGNVDYAINADNTFYITGEFRHGDVVSTSITSYANFEGAHANAVDDVFVKHGYGSYRFVADSVLTTLGYNLALGPTDGLDFSWRWVQSTPTSVPPFVGQRKSYFDNQYSIVYLVRF